MDSVNTETKNDVEAQLLCCCQSRLAGWETALVNWINGNDAWLARRCAARLGSVADAEDAMQEITLKVLHAIDQFEGRSALRTWVTRIADNHCYSIMKQRVASVITDHLQYSIEMLESDRVVSVAVDLENDTSVQITLNALAKKNREILQLRFFCELSLEEIASCLGISLSATKMRLYRAMDSFKTIHGIEAL